jgi:UDP-N-acetylglucosamine 2-epimerase (non-hydrolysing)
MICFVVGARPNFMKVAPVILKARERGLASILVHTGQHYDARMSAIFFDDLKMPKPDVDLNIGSGSHAEQTARTMVAFERVCLERKPSLVVVAGDVNSTLACALTASKLLIPVAHVEAGLRSFDASMPEEINRVLTDHISSLLFTTEPSGNENLLREGICRERIHFVGNSMIDSLRSHLDRALGARPWNDFGLEEGRYGLITLHRPANVDDLKVLSEIGRALRQVAAQLPLLFPVHPRTRERIYRSEVGWDPIKLVQPLGYLEFLGLMARARVVFTDSGGVQEETTILGVPCVTIRPNTERPITIQRGTNRLVSSGREAVVKAAREAMAQDNLNLETPPLWDGRSAVRIIRVIEEWLEQQAAPDSDAA